MKNIGIFSGSFDPVHKGHISFAKAAAKQCNLETVVFMPEATPRNKPHATVLSERLTELEFALADTPFTVLDAKSDQFTVDETLTELEALYPDTHFTFLVGSDVALNLPNWRNIERLVKRFDFAIGMRAGDNKKAVIVALSKADARYTLIETPFAHVSSRQLRP